MIKRNPEKYKKPNGKFYEIDTSDIYKYSKIVKIDIDYAMGLSEKEMMEPGIYKIILRVVNLLPYMLLIIV